METLFIEASAHLSLNICKFEEVALFSSIHPSCPLALTLYAIAIEVLGYLTVEKASFMELLSQT
jgi:hypothetical protein